MKNYRELMIWQRSHRLTLAVYRATQQFPKNELYGLTSQLRRASASVPANIAEGCGRSGDRELARFLQIALGSAYELEYHLLLAFELEFLKTPDYTPLSKEISEIKQMLAGFLKKLQAASCKLQAVSL
jgi:four helix bundle protein